VKLKWKPRQKDCCATSGHDQRSPRRSYL